ncbi:MAG: alpha-mannosidase, partial [Clostridia bacterium]|nr:alpha-mannosidase [Clostridia bacterium]
RLGERVKDNAETPKWQGELYLEFHRGTYTSEARNKKNNRKSEFLLGKAECVSVLAETLCGEEYPTARLREAWQTVLTNQFHDIIPGSSIKEVYEQSDKDYAKVSELGSGVVGTALTSIASRVSEKDGYIIVNDTPFTGDGVVVIDGESVYAEAVPSKGYSVTKNFKRGNHVRVEGKTVETDLYKITFDEHWQICSIIDKRQDREVLSEVGNELRLYVDRPDCFDAWEWQEYSRKQYTALKDVQSATWIDDGVRKGLKIKRKWQSSEILQTVWFYDGLERIDFETAVDWRERHVMLKTAFPVDINADKATYEIQFGNIERPTHFNTSWEQAKFEVCAHKYADISEGGYGVSIVNDCKYGHDIHDGTVQLSLLRSPTYPNAEADQGKHEFTYALCPHTGNFTASDTVKTAYALNDPFTAVKANGQKTALPLRYAAIEADKDNIVCETVKKSEDGDGVVVRLYECKNIRTKASIFTNLPVEKAYLCDMLENELEPLDIKDGKLVYTFGGFEIVTIKLK